MTKFLVRRFFYAIAVVILVTLFVFVLSRASGDPRTVFLNEYTTQEQWDEWGRQWGLDKPVIVQYFLWLGRAATGNLGQSLRESRPVLDVILERPTRGGRFRFCDPSGPAFRSTFRRMAR